MSEEPSKEFNQLTTCQECGKNDPNLVPVDSGLKLILQKAGRDDIPLSVCKGCLKALRGSASLGAQELAKQELKANLTGKLWNNRLQLVKQGHRALQRGDYSEAAVCYEKYLKVLGLAVKKSNRAELDPKLFNEHPKEITVISSVLWDLMLVYDANSKFNQRHLETAELLSKFLRFSPAYNGIIRKVEKYLGKAKNPPAFRLLLKLCDAHASRCFIANEAFGTRVDPTVMLLCQFRDEILRNNRWGRRSIILYYKNSPHFASWLREHPYCKWPVRALLRGVGILLRLIFRLPQRLLS